MSPNAATTAQYAMPAPEMAVDQDARAHRRVGIDVRFESRVDGDLAGVMVIEILDRDAAVEQALQRGPVDRERNVEHRCRVTGLAGDAIEQCNVTLGAGDQDGVDRRGKAKLQQRADAVGVAVENVEMGHEHLPSAGARGRPRAADPGERKR